MTLSLGCWGICIAAADAKRYSAELAGGKVTVTDAPEPTTQVDGLVRELTG
ncbi:MAG TPA: hypothetical protein VIX81_10020 [Gammaproteobacteria bacterium]